MEKFDLKQITENKPLFYTIISCALMFAIVVVLMLFVLTSVHTTKGSAGVSSGTNQQVMKEFNNSDNEPLGEDVSLFTTDNIGKALEVQALLSRNGIETKKETNGSKIEIKLDKKRTKSQRDRAILAIVGSGLIDEHTGLEIFDKGDFTSTKDDKKIRLIRATNGELSRLIRKIDGIENAQVFISIPEQAFFQSEQKPITATVQITIASGKKLDNVKVKAISNLLLGAVNGLEADNISITDTNGTVYNSIIGASDDAIAKIEENDKYMQSKVNAQLDKLLGKGNYIATVSTFLTQSPVEKTSILYDPKQKTAVSEQEFKENLGDSHNDSTSSGMSPVSVQVPAGVQSGIQNGASSQDRKYSRSATETQYGVSKTQVNEYMDAGIIEEISIAVSINENAIPANMSLFELKSLIASAASPKVKPENVSIAYVESNSPVFAPDMENELPKPEESGNPWWVVGALLLIGLILGLSHIGKKVKDANKKQQEELEYLREVAATQEQQLKDVTTQANSLIAQQEQMAQNMLEQKNEYTLAIEQAKNMATAQIQNNNRGNLADAIDELESDFNSMDENEAIEKLKNWIESA